MKATIVDLRYKTKEILKALDRNEEVTLLYHGKVKGKIISSNQITTINIQDHPLFGIRQGDTESVEKRVEDLRGNRYAF